MLNVKIKYTYTKLLVKGGLGMNYSKEVLEKNYREKKYIIDRIQNLSNEEDLESAKNEVKMLTERFLNLGFVGRDNFKEILHEFNAAKKNFYTKVNNVFSGEVKGSLN